LSDEQVVINGSQGEGGGQILRTSLSMSAITGKPVIIESIRANRPKPGLASQHLTGLEAIRKICDATVIGNRLDSTRVAFSPGRVKHGEYLFDVGTAGSVTLVMQTILPALSSIEGRSKLTIAGGTDVKWSPPIDYYGLVHFRQLARFGIECSMKVNRRGYYPRGGGEVDVEMRVSKNDRPEVRFENFSEPEEIKGIVNITGLNRSIADRVRQAALASLPRGLSEITSIEIQHADKGSSQGVGLVLAATDGNVILGGDALGDRGKPAEAVGSEAAGALVGEMKGRAGVDLRASDQLLTYLCMAKPGSLYTARDLTDHARTNAWTIGHFLRDSIHVEKNQNGVKFERA
jgi:RNA 3'-phosphate cyclase